jgi:hypothetical protein
MKQLVAYMAMCLLAMQTQAQIKIPALSPAASVQQQVGLCTVTIKYSRPSLKGRTMLGQASIPFERVWRMGANEVTTFETTDSILIQGTLLPKGRYALLAIPGAKEWTIIINGDSNQWGAYSYSQQKDVLRFTAKPAELKQKMETLSFDFEEITPTSAAVVFRWETTQVKFSLLHNADEKIMAEIKEKTSGEKISPGTLMESAEYYLLMNRDPDQAMDWVNQLLVKRKSPFVYNLKAQIAQKKGNCDIAIEAAKSAVEYAVKNGDVAAKTAAEEIIKSCANKK